MNLYPTGNSLLTITGEIGPGIWEHELSVATLYMERGDRARFWRRWDAFLLSGPEHGHIFRRVGEKLLYHTESFLPASDDGRPCLLLIFGNPASQSTKAGMCFAHEAGGREHRIWGALRDGGLLSFTSPAANESDPALANHARRTEILGMEYASDFRIGVDVLFSMPSPASDPRWSGVAGLRRLFGAVALRRIAEAEGARISNVIARERCVGAIAFQKDAYEALVDPTAPEYTLLRARAGSLWGTLRDSRVPLTCAPPTRYAHTSQFRSILRQCRARFLEEAG